MIYFDIDGVLRDLVTPIFGSKQDVLWNAKKDGKSIIEIIESDLHILEDAPPFDYIYIALECEEICFLSHQPEHWRFHTDKWLDKYFPDRMTRNVCYVDSMNLKIGYIEDGDILIEDYPYFNNEDYSKIILVDRSYNKNVDVPVRVYSPKELCKILSDYKKGTRVCKKL